MMIPFSLSTLLLFLLISSAAAQNYWEQTSGPAGGRVNCLAVSANNTIFSGFNAGAFGVFHKGRGLYRSDDEGVSWDQLYMFSNSNHRSLVIDGSGNIFTVTSGHGVFKSTDNGNWWTFMSPGINYASLGVLGVFKNDYVAWGQEGIYLTTNGGTSWNTILSTEQIHSLYIDNEDNLFAGLYSGGILRSSNYGTSWTRSDQGLLNLKVNAIVQGNDSVFYAGTGIGIFISSDGGNTWNEIPESPMNVTSFCLVNDEIFSGTSGEGFFSSTDNGTTWNPRNRGLVNHHITALAVLTTGSIIAGTHGDGVFITSNRGRTWNPINNNTVSTHITAFIKTNNYMLAGSEQGIIYRSYDNGDTWTRIDSTNTYTQVTSFCRSKKNSLFYSTSGIAFWSDNHDQHTGDEQSVMNLYETDGIYKSEDEGNSWRRTTGLKVNDLEAFYDVQTGIEYMIAAHANGVHLSTDDGETWYPTELNGPYFEEAATNSLGHFYVSSIRYMYKSTDFGNSWNIIFSGNSNIHHTSFIIDRNDYIYAGHDWGKVILSTDHGATWLNIGDNLNTNRINTVTVDSLGNIFTGNWYGEIFQSSDLGNNWRRIQNTPIRGPVFTLFCDDEGNIFMSPYGAGVFRGLSSTFAPMQVMLASPLSGSQNIPLSPELKWYNSPTAFNYRCQVALSMDFDSLSIIFDEITNDTIIVPVPLNEATYYYWRVAAENEFGWSIWSDIFGFKTTLVTDVSEIKESFFYNLVQNFPNPFNPSTMINFSISEQSLVTLKIYDALGSEVETLINEIKPAGIYQHLWNGDDLPSGVYFYRIQAGSFTETKKMVLIK